MKQKKHLLVILASLLMLASVNSQAGRTGISFYYGLGLGVAAPADASLAGTGSALFGVEEDGWSVEGIAYNSLNARIDNSAFDYSINGSHIGLAFRTIEKDKKYFKYKVSSTSMDFDYTPGSPTTSTSGISYSFAMGLRTSRETRAELEYSLYNADELSDPVHLLTLRYIWGGSPYQGRAF